MTNERYKYISRLQCVDYIVCWSQLCVKSWYCSVGCLGLSVMSNELEIVTKLSETNVEQYWWNSTVYSAKTKLETYENRRKTGAKRAKMVAEKLWNWLCWRLWKVDKFYKVSNETKSPENKLKVWKTKWKLSAKMLVQLSKCIWRRTKCVLSFLLSKCVDKCQNLTWK